MYLCFVFFVLLFCVTHYVLCPILCPSPLCVVYVYVLLWSCVSLCVSCPFNHHLRNMLPNTSFVSVVLFLVLIGFKMYHMLCSIHIVQLLSRSFYFLTHHVWVFMCVSSLSVFSFVVTLWSPWMCNWFRFMQCNFRFPVPFVSKHLTSSGLEMKMNKTTTTTPIVYCVNKRGSTSSPFNSLTCMQTWPFWITSRDPHTYTWIHSFTSFTRIPFQLETRSKRQVVPFYQPYGMQTSATMHGGVSHIPSLRHHHQHHNQHHGHMTHHYGHPHLPFMGLDAGRALLFQNRGLMFRAILRATLKLYAEIGLLASAMMGTAWWVMGSTFTRGVQHLLNGIGNAFLQMGSAIHSQKSWGWNKGIERLVQESKKGDDEENNQTHNTHSREAGSFAAETKIEVTGRKRRRAHLQTSTSGAVAADCFLLFPDHGIPCVFI